MQVTYSLSTINPEETHKYGHRAASLATLQKQKMPIATSFIVSSGLYEDYQEQTGLRNEIAKILEQMDFVNKEKLEETYWKIKDAIERRKIPEEYNEQLKEAYEALSIGANTSNAQGIIDEAEPTVNLIASPSYTLGEDSRNTIILNIKGYEQFLDSIRSAYLTLFTPKETEYRSKNGITEFTAAIIVEQAKEPDKTIEVQNDPEQASSTLVKAYHGALDIIGEASKDIYQADEQAISAVKITTQNYKIIYAEKSGILIRRNNVDKAGIQKLSESQIMQSIGLLNQSQQALSKKIKLYITQSKDKQTIMLAEDLQQQIPSNTATNTTAPNPIEESRQGSQYEEYVRPIEKELEAYIDKLYYSKTGMYPESIDNAIIELSDRAQLPDPDDIITMKQMISIAKTGEQISIQSLYEIAERIQNASKGQ